MENDFNKKLKYVIKQFKKIDWDICFLDLLNNNRYRYFKKRGLIKNIYNKNRFASYGLGAYIINLKTANKFVKDLYKFTLPMDEEIKNYIITKKLKAYFVNPPLFHQGSIYGPYSTTNNNKIKSKNILSFRRKIYQYIESKRFKSKYWFPIIIIKDILQEFEIYVRNKLKI